MKNKNARSWKLEVGSRGFTLIELLVVISIIGILATLLIANMNATRARARDAQRKADLRNIQTALRIYFNDNNKYPGSDGGQIKGCGEDGSELCSWGGNFASGGQTYMAILPDDPSPDRDYLYTYDSNSLSYTLAACLENQSDDKCMKDGENIIDCSADWDLTSGCKYQVVP